MADGLSWRKGRSEDVGRAPGVSQAILRALSVLRALRTADGELGVAEIARGVELPTTTVHRILLSGLSCVTWEVAFKTALKTLFFPIFGPI